MRRQHAHSGTVLAAVTDVKNVILEMAIDGSERVAAVEKADVFSRKSEDLPVLQSAVSQAMDKGTACNSEESVAYCPGHKNWSEQRPFEAQRSEGSCGLAPVRLK